MSQNEWPLAHLSQTYPIPPGRFPLRKAFNELRSRWDEVVATSRGETQDLAECSYASTPLVTHGAWRGHTFASAAMHTFYKQHMEMYIEELDAIKENPGVLRMRTRGRKSKKTAYLIDLVERLKQIKKNVDESGSGEFVSHDIWGTFYERA